ncbi:MAG TPA: M23 family metallopeptidase [Vicinamibacterales bacterium]|nr:M23 family metallopeptidase [Vicinamibacterales bacterium]
MKWIRSSIVLFAVAAFGCNQPPPPRPALQDAPTHERYTAALSEFGLDKTALGQDWLAAANQALANPIPTSLPFRESGYLPPADPSAIGYAFELRRGRRLVIDVSFETASPARLYVDLFEAREEEPPRRVAGAEPGQLSFTYDARRDGLHILRLQPELLRGGRYTIVERTTASLGFPVQGVSLGAAHSGFGAPRDGGRRDHHGIDIFAPRGTPVVAAVDGVVRVDTSDRGGQVIWLSPLDRRGRLYYAHLHDWAVTNGASVRAGQVIGYVGNTGNARTTPPHLHFGVYDRGPVDPHPYLRPDDPQPAEISAALSLVGEWARVRAGRAAVHAAPHARASTSTIIDAGTIVRVRAAAAGFFRIDWPDTTVAFVRARELEALERPVSTATLAEATEILEAPDAEAPVVDSIAARTSVDVLGASGTYRLVRFPNRQTGWIAAPTPAAAIVPAARPRQ